MDTIEGKLIALDSLKKELDGLRPLKTEQVKNLKTLFHVNFTYNSTAIEGNTFSYQETKVVLLDGITIGGKSVREHLEIINHREAIDYIEALSHKKTTELTRTDILNVHSIILRGIDSKNAGAYRTVPVYDEMDRFFHWLFSASKEHPVIFAAQAHTHLVSIHPFVDGNGRTARLILNLILLQHGYVPAIIKNKDRAQYLDALELWQNKDKREDFYTMVIDYEKESLETYLKTITENIIWK